MDQRTLLTAEPLRLPEQYPALKRGTLVRVLSPLGYYWREGFRAPEALYSSSPDLVFIACHFDEARHEGDFYSEFDDPVLEEVRLLAALSLAIGWDGGLVSLYLHPCTLKVPEFLDLGSEAVECHLRERILAVRPEELSKLLSDPPLPPSHGGPAYEFRNSPTPSELQRDLFEKIADSDHLLMRGLTAWLKAAMLRHHRLFALEALYSMYVSLDASFSLICEKLREQGVRNPTAVDAGEFLDHAEGREPEGQPYFGDFYADRIQLLHPSNRFGVVPYPPAFQGDLYHLNQSLREVYRLLILGQMVDPLNFVSAERK